MGEVESLNDLSRIYYTPEHPGGFSGADKLANAVSGRFTKKQVKDWLQSQETYTLHKSASKRFPRNKYIVSNINYLWQADLSDMRSLSQYNDEYNYILCVIDVFSKFAYARPLKKKDSKSIIRSFKSIFAETNSKPEHLQTDKGTEFTSKQVRNLFKSFNINYYVTNNPDIKASIVERFQRTLKGKMWRYFTYKNTYRYIDVLDNLVLSYNNSKHSSIQMCPSQVNSDNISTVWQNLYDRGSSKKKTNVTVPHLKIGDHVRITKMKYTFEKGYETNWSDEIFAISSILPRKPWFVYTLQDLKGEHIQGTFYERELQRIVMNSNSFYKIEKVLKSRYTGQKKEILVKWKGYPNKFNTWIPYSNVTNLS